MRILKLKLNKKTLSLMLLSGLIVAGSSKVGHDIHFEKTNTCELKSKSISELLENEEIRNNTTIDEELILGKINILKEDQEFRKHAKLVTADKLREDPISYYENLNWLKEHYEETVKDIMFASGKGAVADAMKEETANFKLRPVTKNDDDLFFANRGSVEYQDSTQPKILYIKSKELGLLVSAIAGIQDENYSLDSALEIAKNYDNMINASNNVTMTGINRNNDKLVSKYSKNYVKKNIMKKKINL